MDFVHWTTKDQVPPPGISSVLGADSNEKHSGSGSHLDTAALSSRFLSIHGSREQMLLNVEANMHTFTKPISLHTTWNQDQAK